MSRASFDAYPRWIAEADVCDAIDLEASVRILRAALGSEPSATNWTMAKTQTKWDGGGTLHALGGGLGESGVVGVKSWAHTPGGATPLLALWDAEAGQLLAVIEAFALGQLRTAAITALATDLLTRGINAAAIIGTGKQALPQAAAMLAVREFDEIRVWSPTPERRARFVRDLRNLVPVEVSACATLEEAVDGVDVITTATRARTGFLNAAHARPGLHVNAIGAIGPDRGEICSDFVALCDVVVADNIEAATTMSSELDERARSSITSLGDVISGQHSPKTTDMSLFKAMGLGLADVALGAEVLRYCRASALGRSILPPTRQTPTLTTRR